MKFSVIVQEYQKETKFLNSQNVFYNFPFKRDYLKFLFENFKYKLQTNFEVKVS